MNVVEEKPHSRVGPSSLERAEECPSSVPLARSLPKEVTANEYADEGSVAHAVMEKCLLENREAFEFTGETYEMNGEEIEVTEEMVGHIDDMLAHIREITAEYGNIELEVRLDYPEDLPGYGWADVAASSDRKTYAVIADLKYGAGIAVSADSLQLAAYLVSLIARDYGSAVFHEGAPDEVLGETHILQPRKGGIKPKLWTRQELRGILARMRRILEKVASGERQFKGGEHCRFCPAAGPLCPEMTQRAKDSVMVEIVGDPQVLTDNDFDAQKLDDAYAIIKPLKMWIKNVEDMAQKYIEHGGKLMSAKAVPKRASRQWADEEMAQMFLETHGIDPWQPRKLLTAPMAEKKLSKPLKAELNEMVTKESSGHRIVGADEAGEPIVFKKAAVSAALRQQTARKLLTRAEQKDKS